jgi:hypothetical protein
MKTATIIENVERKEIGGRKAAIVTMLGGAKAGTFEGPIAKQCEALVGKDVGLELRTENGKTIIVSVEAIDFGEGNPLDEVEPEPQSVVDNADVTPEPEPTPEKEAPDVADVEVGNVGGTLSETRDLLAEGNILANAAWQHMVGIEKRVAELEGKKAKPAARKPAAKPAAKKPAAKRTAAKKKP